MIVNSKTTLSEKALHPRPEDCLAPTEFMDYEHPSVRAWLKVNLKQKSDAVETAKELYYLVRDGWRYNPYTLSRDRAHSKASWLLTQKQSYCIPKALLFATFARAVGIPARIGFGDVQNHLSSPRFTEYLGTDVFAWHGFAELYLNNTWVRGTPAFDARLCRKFKVAPLEFDGHTDSLFQEFDTSGRKFMDYIRYRGVYGDLPFDEIMASLAEIYPKIFHAPIPEGDLHNEVG